MESGAELENVPVALNVVELDSRQERRRAHGGRYGGLLSIFVRLQMNSTLGGGLCIPSPGAWPAPGRVSAEDEVPGSGLAAAAMEQAQLSRADVLPLRFGPSNKHAMAPLLLLGGELKVLAGSVVGFWQ